MATSARARWCSCSWPVKAYSIWNFEDLSRGRALFRLLPLFGMTGLPHPTACAKRFRRSPLIEGTHEDAT